MTCFFDEILVIMFNLDFDFLELLTILWILLILLAYSLGKISLIFKISVVDGKEACAYDLLTSFFSNPSFSVFYFFFWNIWKFC